MCSGTSFFVFFPRSVARILSEPNPKSAKFVFCGILSCRSDAIDCLVAVRCFSAAPEMGRLKKKTEERRTQRDYLVEVLCPFILRCESLVPMCWCTRGITSFPNSLNYPLPGSSPWAALFISKPISRRSLFCGSRK